MTRIIAGRAKGATLKVPPTGTRPTSDRVREAIFSSLNHQLNFAGINVLDLFAGSGALGLESYSRGAGQVTLVDASAKAVSICQENARKLGIESVQVLKCKVNQYLSAVPAVGWDLVFMDPPYDISASEIGQSLELLVPYLTLESIVVLELGSRSEKPVLPVGLEVYETKKYGETVIYWIQLTSPETEV